MSHPQALKMLVAGRVIIIDTREHVFTLAILLQSNSISTKNRTFTALILCEQKQDVEWNRLNKSDDPEPQIYPEDGSPIVKPFRTNQLYRPEGPCPSCEIIKVKTADIFLLTTKTIKVNADRIIDDIRKRQQPRFRYVCEIIICFVSEGSSFYLVCVLVCVTHSHIYTHTHTHSDLLQCNTHLNFQQSIQCMLPLKVQSVTQTHSRHTLSDSHFLMDE